MTLETFLEKLEQTPRDWTFDEAGRLRRKDKKRTCPVYAVAGAKGSACPYFYADRMKLGSRETRDVIRAADFKAKTVLRAKLLKACGLESA